MSPNLILAWLIIICKAIKIKYYSIQGKYICDMLKTFLKLHFTYIWCILKKSNPSVSITVIFRYKNLAICQKKSLNKCVY